MSLTPKPVNFEETWQKIDGTLRSVITSGEASSAQEMEQKRSDWKDRFSDIYALCVASPEPFTSKLYERTMQFFHCHVELLYKEKISISPNILKDYQVNWNQYSQGSHHINSLYRYLNTNYCKKKKSDHLEPQAPLLYPPSQSENNLEIGHLALNFWKKGMIDMLRDTLVKALIDSVRRDRNGEAPSQTVIHDVVRSFIDVEEYESRATLKLYQEIFEECLLVETSEFYQKEATKLLEYCDCSQYMQKVDTRLEEESLRAQKYFHRSSYEKVVNVCQEKLVEDQLQLLQSECREMIHNERLTDLSRMYKLLKPLSKGLSLMLKEFEEYIADTGLAKVKAFYTENGTGQFVDALLEIHKKYTEIIETTFNNDQGFLGARDKACTKIVNHRLSQKKQCKSPEMLAKYCDSLLKKSTKHLTELEIDDKLNNVIVIFKYIDDKDVFQKFYSKLLAKRLVYNMSVSMDSEESMINRLKLACGYEYTNKLHRMFTDMKISEDLNNKFTQFLEPNKTDVGISFSVLVLQSGAWPLSQSTATTVSLPTELVKSVQMFETFYNGIYNGRKLTWLTHLSNGEMKMTFQKKTYIVTITTYQMAILLLFNSDDNLSFRDIQNQCQLADKELSRTLQSLIDVKLLLRSPKETTEITECIFQLNTDFSNKRTKFKITAAVQKDSSQEVEQTHSAVSEDRKMYIQATAVRIMKRSKTLKHNVLMQEIVTQVQARFSPSISMIKKCIESLIDKQYIERTQGTKDEYTYLA